MSFFDDVYPKKYTDKENEVSKALNMVVCIEGLDQCISIVPTYTKIRYGDPGITYGLPGVVYGGLRIDDSVRVGLSLEGSNLVISQRLEPEQGRAAVTTMTLQFVDFDQYFSKLITPNGLLDEPLGNKLVKVWMGYADSSFKEDYFVIFRGYISSTRSQSGRITLQLSDANLKRRSNIFSNQLTKLDGGIDNSQTAITVNNTVGFLQQILGPDGNYDSSIKTYIKIDDEFMEYGTAGIASPTQFNVTRGSRGSTAVTHDTDTDVSNYLQLEGNVIDLALKIMMSGWNGDYVSDIDVGTIINLYDYGSFNDGLRLTDGKDAIEDYGISVGSYITISGSTVGNDGQYVVRSIASSNGRTNNIIRMTTDFVAIESPATGVKMSVRSKYDTLPTACGLKLKPTEVDISAWESLRDQFLNTPFYRMRFLIGDKKNGKEFIEKELLLPTGAYSITRFGKLSVKLTLPPLAGTKIPYLDISNVLEPQNIVVERAMNTRRFFNDVQYQYDADDTNTFRNINNYLDTDSLNLVGASSQLPIKSLGLKTDLGAQNFIDRRALSLLNRYKDAAYEIQNVKTNWGTGSLIEAGDVLILSDNGQLQITNLNTGERNLGTQLFEVIDRQVDIKSGQVTLRLLSNIGYDVTDRFAVISPSTQISATGSYGNKIRIEDSFGVLFPGDEKKKWEPFIGERIHIHKKDYSNEYFRILVGFDAANPYDMQVDDAIPVALDDTWIVDIPYYPDTTNVGDDQLYKTVFAHIDYNLPVISGVSATEFTVNIAFVSQFIIGRKLRIHNTDFSNDSGEVKIIDVVGNLITVEDMGFTPAANDVVDLISFPDAAGPYRIL